MTDIQKIIKNNKIYRFALELQYTENDDSKILLKQILQNFEQNINDDYTINTLKSNSKSNSNSNSYSYSRTSSESDLLGSKKSIFYLFHRQIVYIYTFIHFNNKVYQRSLIHGV
jgi:hypothetical protein